MNQRRPQLIRVAVVLIVAFIASALRYGFPPSEGWIPFLGAMVFFTGVQIPIWLQQTDLGINNLGTKLRQECYRLIPLTPSERGQAAAKVVSRFAKL